MIHFNFTLEDDEAELLSHLFAQYIFHIRELEIKTKSEDERSWYNGHIKYVQNFEQKIYDGQTKVEENK